MPSADAVCACPTGRCPGLVWALMTYEGTAGWSVTERAALTSWRSGEGTLPPSGGSAAPVPRESDENAATSEERDLGELADGLHPDEPFLDEVVELLRDKGRPRLRRAGGPAGRPAPGRCVRHVAG